MDAATAGADLRLPQAAIPAAATAVAAPANPITMCELEEQLRLM